MTGMRAATPSPVKHFRASRCAKILSGSSGRILRRKAAFDFLTYEALSRLTEAMKIDPERWALALLGADASLRQGEI